MPNFIFNSFDFSALKVFVYLSALIFATLHDAHAMAGKSDFRKGLDVRQELKICPAPYSPKYCKSEPTQKNGETAPADWLNPLKGIESLSLNAPPGRD